MRWLRRPARFAASNAAAPLAMKSLWTALTVTSWKPTAAAIPTAGIPRPARGHTQRKRLSFGSGIFGPLYFSISASRFSGIGI
jgi:hypothetical protein